jgi:hypothetical protein
MKYVLFPVFKNVKAEIVFETANHLTSLVWSAALTNIRAPLIHRHQPIVSGISFELLRNPRLHFKSISNLTQPIDLPMRRGWKLLKNLSNTTFSRQSGILINKSNLQLGTASPESPGAFNED